MAQVLELPELAERDRVAEVDVDPGRVDAVLDAEGPVLADRSLQLLEEFVLGDDLLDPAAEDLELFVDVPHRSARLLGTRKVRWSRMFDESRKSAKSPILGPDPDSDKVA